MKVIFFAILAFIFFDLNAQVKTEIDQVAALYSSTQVIGDITYKTIGDIKLKLDIYVPTKRLGGPVNWVEYTEKRKPTLLFFHGGGWQSGDKISRSLFLMPYVQKGFVVVTANYRHIPANSLKELITDTRAAMNWVYENADKYKMDTTKIVLSGESAGGHLAQINGFLDDENYFEQEHNPISRKMKAAAVVNWFGVFDLNTAAKDWDDDQIKNVTQNKISQAIQILTAASPSTYLDKNDPPIISIHGNMDISAKYDQSVLLHQKLNELGVKNKFITIKGKKHGDFSPLEMTMAMKEIWEFLNGIGIK